MAALAGGTGSRTRGSRRCASRGGREAGARAAAAAGLGRAAAAQAAEGVAGAAGARLQAVREPLLRVERGGGGGGVPLRGRRRRLRRCRRRRAAAALGGLVPACGALRGPGLHGPATCVRRVQRWARRAGACLQMSEA